MTGVPAPVTYEYTITADWKGINEMGAQGWRLCQVLDTDDTVTHIGGVTRVALQPFIVWERII
jgi:hypothetical protein